MIGNLKPLEIILILVVILLLFGAKKLPDMARSLGKSARILKSEAKAMKKDGTEPTAPHHGRPSPTPTPPRDRRAPSRPLPETSPARARSPSPSRTDPELTADAGDRPDAAARDEDVGCSSLPASRRRTPRGGCPSRSTCVSCATGC